MAKVKRRDSIFLVVYNMLFFSFLFLMHSSTRRFCSRKRAKGHTVNDGYALLV